MLRKRAGLDLRLLDLVAERRIDGDGAIGGELDKTLRQIEVARGKGGADLAVGGGAIENIGKRPVADLRGIGRDFGQMRLGVDSTANEHACRDRKQARAKERQERMAQRICESI